MGYFYGILCVVGWTWTLVVYAMFEREFIRELKTK